MSKFVPGQRWVSESEPELGLGRVLRAVKDRVEVEFRAAGELRTYVTASAPLRRVQFRVGDKINTDGGREVTITKVEEQSGLIYYGSDHGVVAEEALSDHLSLRGPQERMFSGNFDSFALFDLRRRTLEWFHRARESPVLGFVGGRINLVAHQLYIAQEVANRFAPRVMLSDEVGLGKTIEACLIVHRLLLSGRAGRVLVIVPDSLVHQWFVEMLRRFSISMRIFDEDRCASIEASDPGSNPFLDEQLVLTSVDFLARDARRGVQCANAGWDLLVVDEVHHLAWSPAAPSRAYQVVEEVCRNSAGVLLLTATPEQLGLESHFARLRLLDPDRYRDLETFQAESKEYRQVADLAETLDSHKTLNAQQLRLARKWLVHDPEIDQRLATVKLVNSDARQVLLQELLDLHGPGRVLFRNTRSTIQGFPKRTARLTKLPAGSETATWLDRLSNEFAADAGEGALESYADFAKDPRIAWLVQTLQLIEPSKVLLIVRSVAKAEAIDSAVRQHVSIKTALFHEGLTLIQRDRNAAWFADPDGARLLICSEIGSEGRNFQFAHHLILFDLPLNPELLEQRIGRLDRIGQTHEIEIHVPFVEHSPQEVLARWYHQGLNAFEQNLEGGNDLLLRFGREVHDLALEFPVADRLQAEQELVQLLERTSSSRQQLRRTLEQGRDRLLELNSFRPASAQKLIELIHKEDQSLELEEYLMDVLEHFGVHPEELAARTWQLNPQGVITDSFPAIPSEGLTATFERARALAREDVAFLTLDHPIVTGAVDLLLGSETGNCSFAVLPSSNERTLLLETVFILEPIGNPRLHADRFLGPTPIHLIVNHKQEDLTDSYRGSDWSSTLQKGVPFKLIENAEIARRTLPAMLEKAEASAHARALDLRRSALDRLRHQLGYEIQRLQMLQRVNDHVRPEEITLAQAHERELAIVLETSRLRLDCLRLIWKGPAGALQ